VPRGIHQVIGRASPNGHVQDLVTPLHAESEAGRRRDVKGVGLATCRQHTGRNVSLRERFHRLVDRVNRGPHSVNVTTDHLRFVLRRVVDLGLNYVGDDARAANAVEKPNQSLHHLRAVSRLPRREASPDACFEVKGRHDHGGIACQ
jgi:hypothetical protein